MVLCGQVNKAVVNEFTRQGVRAAGISGRDGGLLRARVKNPALGLVGTVEAVDPALPRCLLEGGFVPVVAPVASGPDGEALNINADTAAGALAGAIGAEYFVLISDVPGVLDADGRLIPSLNRKEIQKLRETGVITGGMYRPKPLTALAVSSVAIRQASKPMISNGGRSTEAVCTCLKELLISLRDRASNA